jgi:Trk K+ transport system NAD-binding subunit
MVKEIKLPGNILIVSIIRNHKTIIPHGETIFHIDDVIEVYGMEADIKVTRTLLGSE